MLISSIFGTSFDLQPKRLNCATRNNLNTWKYDTRTKEGANKSLI